MKKLVKEIINKKRAIETTGLDVEGVRWDKSFPSGKPHSAVYAMGLRPIVNEQNYLVGVYEEDADYDEKTDMWETFESSRYMFNKTERMVLRRAGL